LIEKLFQKDEKLIFTFYDLFKSIIFFLSFYLSYKVRFIDDSSLAFYLSFTIIFSLLHIFVAFYFRKNFFFNTNIWQNFKVDFLFILITLIILLLIMYLMKSSSNYSRIWLVIFIFLNIILLIPYKLISNLLYLKIIKSNLFSKNVLIIGTYNDCKKVLYEFRDKPNYHFRAMSLLNKSHNHDFLPIQELKLDQNIGENLRYNKISQVWIIYNFNFNRSKIIDYFQTIPIDIRTLIPRDINEDEFIDKFGNYNFYNTSISTFYGIKYFIKILIDLIFSTIFLIISFPIIIISAFFIIIEDGFPVFFTQNRYGWDGNLIKIYKLRSLKKTNEKFNQVVKNDKRLLKTGRVIRKLSIDELPQLLNIILGQMSLVGPRPHPVELDDEFSKKIRGFMQRLRCKPGLTGLAQVNGYRGPTLEKELMDKRFSYDLEYIKKWTIILDLKIIIKTMFVFLFQKVD